MTPARTAAPPAFSALAKDKSGRARAGVLRSPRGEIETPVFMPVATQASVKALSQDDLASVDARILLANAYHLYLRPGVDIVRKAGGLHGFMNYPGTLLTDSGGFQVMSLAGLREIDDHGVTFKSHLDGSVHTLTPESVIGIQKGLGSDVWTSLDECVKYPCDEATARRALDRTLRWTERAHDAYAAAVKDMESPALFFPIIQGSVYPALRRQAAEHLAGIEHHGISIGGVSVGEPKPLMWETVSGITEVLPEDKPRYLMGVGTPEDLWEAVGRGVDMMDCVWPTRVARHGMAMVHTGRMNLMNAAFKEDFSPLDPDCACRVCRAHSRAYLSHLFRANELTAMYLLSYHNVHFLMEIMRLIRNAILDNRFEDARAEFFSKYASRTPAE